MVVATHSNLSKPESVAPEDLRIGSEVLIVAESVGPLLEWHGCELSLAEHLHEYVCLKIFHWTVVDCDLPFCDVVVRVFYLEVVVLLCRGVDSPPHWQHNSVGDQDSEDCCTKHH